MKEEKTIPEFKSEQEMADFWDTHSVADYWDQLEPDEIELAPELAAKIAERSKTKRVTLRLRVSQIEAAKRIAKEKDIPYQTLLRSWIAEAIRREQEKRA
ncbi:CopG antitoxin of type II toxin-antitoxin system [Thermodesulfitimonas autotrophica]|uniref:CopG antitoxin of type II toxin-antitoxin system n=1 Tax=Thermodesulfitimonas autotrophica TaxID=1894989 RepID=A0A3N5ABQ8_9THEO|nr:CopG family antitoxin [Thermodesulfitimonas autotrophica]RPF42024.1 CopG antitoxin of type II toxin-antitoxin system [Thermodesulfitimonas autotrophica]